VEKYMRKSRVVQIVLASVASSLLIGGAAAQAKPEDAIAYRQGVYKIIGWNFGPMAAMVKGERPYDKEAFAKHAGNVAAVAPMALEGFGPGTDKGANTKAKPEVWSKMDDFKSKMAKMNEEATKLAAVAKTGSFDDIKKQFGATGASCKACHDDYRNK
jgi:cytochrome c556